MSELAYLRRFAEAAARARPGRWYLQDACSFRRIGTDGHDGDVVSGTNQQDGHPDLRADRAVLYYIAVASPGVVLDLLDRIETAEQMLGAALAAAPKEPGDAS